MTSVASTTVRAPAKINLFLRVLGARSDGFHDLETLFQAVSLHDLLEIELTDGGEVALVVEGADVGPATSNLAYRAARAALDAVGSDAGVRIRLLKRIPAGAGLGGGSSDAAATLRALNALLGSPLDSATLAELGAALGSDVPFFLGESTLALGSGRGERLEGVHPLPVAHLVLALPPVHVSTAWAYRALDETRAGRDGAGEAPCLNLIADAPRSWAEAAALARNDFQAVVAEAHPQVARSLDALRRAGGAPTLLSGSGAACFGVFPDAGEADAAAAALAGALPWRVLTVETLRGWP